MRVFRANCKRVLAEVAEKEDAGSGNAPPPTPAADEFRGETVDVVGVPDTRLDEGE